MHVLMLKYLHVSCSKINLHVLIHSCLCLCNVNVTCVKSIPNSCIEVSMSMCIHAKDMYVHARDMYVHAILHIHYMHRKCVHARLRLWDTYPKFEINFGGAIIVLVNESTQTCSFASWSV